jgi:deazaflavin-dependent oxidoreductase (nitroreductase family)
MMEVPYDIAERFMAEANDWNSKVIKEFRESGGAMGGDWAGQPMVLVHHTGRKTGQEHVTPMMYLANDDDVDLIYVFASKAGAPTDPDWYKNLVAAGSGAVEIGTESYDVAVTELTGEERDTVYAEQARRYPAFAEYEEKTAGLRTIPVLALRRA